MTQEQPSLSESQFSQALQRYQDGADAADVIDEFEAITKHDPRQSAGWTCLAWLQLLTEDPEEALRSAKTAVKLNAQDPQGRLNLALAMLETGAKGVREHIEIVKRVMAFSPELGQELEASIADGLKRRPGWPALLKVQAWLAD
jgi:predicted Zn-dependent protease